MQDTYRTIGSPAEGEFRDRGSKFLAYAFPVASEAEAMVRLEEIRRLHPKARHHCYAYRLGLDGNRYRANDDGEPSGTAGRPILGQIDSFEVTNIFIGVVRYFGGTLLGAGGLIHAYRTAAREALASAGVVERIVEETFTLHFGYELMNNVMNAVSRLDLPMGAQRFADAAEVDITVRRSEIGDKLRRLKALIADVYLEEVNDEYQVPGLEIRPARG